MKQRLTKLRFERLYMRADRWLSDAKLIGRNIETAAVDDAFEDTKAAGAGGNHEKSQAGPPAVIARWL